MPQGRELDNRCVWCLRDVADQAVEGGYLCVDCIPIVLQELQTRLSGTRQAALPAGSDAPSTPVRQLRSRPR